MRVNGKVFNLHIKGLQKDAKIEVNTKGPLYENNVRQA